MANSGYRVRVLGFHVGRRRPAGFHFPFSLWTLPVASRGARWLRNLTMGTNIILINALLVVTRARFYHAHNTMFLLGMYMGSRLHGGKFVYDAHEVQWEKGRVLAGLEAFFIKRADGIINVAPGRARAMAARYGVPLSRITVLFNYPIVDATILPRPSSDDGDLMRLVFSGGYDLANNRMDVLLEAMREVPGIDLYLMAFGYRDSETILRRLVLEYGLSDRVHFLPLVKPHEVMATIRVYDAAVNLLTNPRGHVSIKYPGVNKMYEYLAAGLPILCSDLDGFVEEFVREGAAVSVNADDSTSVAAGLRWLCKNRGPLADMRKRAVDLARTRYNWEAQEARLIELYAGLANEQSRASGGAR